MQRNLVSLFLSIFAALAMLVVSGCGNNNEPAEDGGGSTAEAEAILESTRLAMAQLDNYQADLTMDFSGQSEGTVRMEVFLKGNFLGDTGGERPQFKGIVTESTLPSAPEGTVAILGPTSYVYDPTQNVVAVGQEGSDSPQPYSDLYGLFLGNQTRAVTLISPNVTNPTVAGEETVGEFETTRIELNPTDLTSTIMAPGASGTIWIDKDTSLPVKFDYSEDGFGVVWTVNSMSLEPLEDSVFEPGDAIPADATEIGEETSPISEVASLDEAVNEAGFTPLVPSYLPSELPSTPTSVGVQQTPLGSIIIQSYAVSEDVEADPETVPEDFENFNPIETRSIVIRAIQSEVGFPGSLAGTTSEVNVRGQDATLTSIDNGRVTVTWVEDGTMYEVVSNGYGEDEVLQVAEGLE
jgi:outer membrane lipoprotein-sorting protein